MSHNFFAIKIFLLNKNHREVNLKRNKMQEKHTCGIHKKKFMCQTGFERPIASSANIEVF